VDYASTMRAMFFNPQRLVTSFVQLKFTAKQAGCPTCPPVVAESRNSSATLSGLKPNTKVFR